MQQRPRFRNDLVSKPIEENGQRFVDVTDPDSGKTFRFYEVEYAVACAMNGDRSVNDLVDWARAELGLEPSARELETVISTLGDLGYLAANGQSDLDLALGSPGKSPMDSGSTDRAPSESFELGDAGKSPMGGPPKSPRAPAANLELGAAGFGGAEAPTPVVEAIPEPPPEPSQDVSTDLSAHLEIGTDDVKEAVRQSKVMEAVNVPADLVPDPAADQRPQIERPPQPPPGATPIELPGRPAAPAPQPHAQPTQPKPPPQPRSGSNLTIILLIVVLVLAVGGAVYYFFVYAKDEPQGERRPRGAGVEKNVRPDTKEAPPKVVSTLKAGSAVEAVIKAPKAGRLEWIAAAGDEVDEGGVVARYRGYERAAKKLAAAKASRDRYQEKLERAKERDNKKSIARAAADVERKEQDMANYASELRGLAVMADKAGVVTPVAEEKATVTEGQELLKIATTSRPSVTFEVPDPSKHEVGDKAEIAAESDASLTAICDVEKIEGNKVTVACPTDSGIDEGSAVALKP